MDEQTKSRQATAAALTGKWLAMVRSDMIDAVLKYGLLDGTIVAALAFQGCAASVLYSLGQKPENVYGMLSDLLASWRDNEVAKFSEA